MPISTGEQLHYSLFPGPPDTPAALSLPGTHVDMELRQFSVEWNVPFSHPNHSISHYSVSVNSLNQSLSYDETLPVSSAVQPPLPTSGLVSVSLPFPRRTFSCDILNISVTAVNDIGASQPAYGYVLIPKGDLQPVTSKFYTSY